MIEIQLYIAYDKMFNVLLSVPTFVTRSNNNDGLVELLVLFYLIPRISRISNYIHYIQLYHYGQSMRAIFAFKSTKSGHTIIGLAVKQAALAITCRCSEPVARESVPASLPHR